MISRLSQPGASSETGLPLLTARFLAEETVFANSETFLSRSREGDGGRRAVVAMLMIATKMANETRVSNIVKPACFECSECDIV